MNNPLDNYNETNNFWDFNPQYKVIFKDIYTEDKSKGKDKSSKLMWGLILYSHPKSDFYNLPDKDILISRDIIGDKKFKWESYKNVLDRLREISLSQAEKSLDDWNHYMKKRDEYLKTVRYYFDEYMTDENGDNVLSKMGNFVTIKGTAEQLDKAWLSSKAMWADYGKIMKELFEEESKKGKGNKNLSESDKGEI